MVREACLTVHGEGKFHFFYVHVLGLDDGILETDISLIMSLHKGWPSLQLWLV